MTNVKTSSVAADTKQKDATPVIETPVVETPVVETPKTDAQIIAELKKSAQDATQKYMEALSGGAPDLEIQKLMSASIDAGKKLSNQINEFRARDEKKKLDTAKDSHANELLTPMFTFYDEFRTAEATYNRSKKTAEDIKIFNVVNEKFNVQKQKVFDAIRETYKAPKNEETHVPMGTTGKSLAANPNLGTTTNKNGENKSARIKELLESGMDADTIVSQTGYERKLVTDTRWNWEKSTGRR